MSSTVTVIVAGAQPLADALTRTGQFASVVPVSSTSQLRDLLQSRTLSPGVGDKVFVFSDTVAVDTEQSLEFLISKLTSLGARALVLGTTPVGRAIVSRCPGAGLVEGEIRPNVILGALAGAGVGGLSPVAEHDNSPVDLNTAAQAIPAAPGPANPFTAPAPVPAAALAPADPPAVSPFTTPPKAAPPAAPAAVPEAAPTNPFGAPVATEQPAANPFGAPAPQEAPAANPFGAPAPQEAPAANPFGAPAPQEAPAANPFGTSPVSSPFNAPPAPVPAATNPFGAPPAPSSGNPFGVPAPQEAPAVSPFGTPATSGFPTSAGSPDPFSAPPQIRGTSFDPAQIQPASPFGAPAARPGSASGQPRRGFVVTVTAPKGGTGKSSLTLNLAAYMALRMRGTGQNVCVIDANVQQADTGKYLNAFSPNVEDVLRDPAAINPDRITQYLLHRPALNLSALLGPATPDTANPLHFTGRRYGQILEALKPNFDYIFIDTPVAELYHDIFREFALPMADFVVVAVTPNVTTLLNTDMWLRQVTAPRAANGMGIDPARIGVVLNRAEDGIGCSEDEVRANLAEWRYMGAVPETKEWKYANNRGEIVASKNYTELNSAFAQVLAQATGASDLIEGSDLAAGPRQGLLDRFRRKR